MNTYFRAWTSGLRPPSSVRQPNAAEGAKEMLPLIPPKRKCFPLSPSLLSSLCKCGQASVFLNMPSAYLHNKCLPNRAMIYFSLCSFQIGSFLLLVVKFNFIIFLSSDNTDTDFVGCKAAAVMPCFGILTICRMIPINRKALSGISARGLKKKGASLCLGMSQGETCILLGDLRIWRVLLACEGQIYFTKYSSSGHKCGQWHFRPEVKMWLGAYPPMCSSTCRDTFLEKDRGPSWVFQVAPPICLSISIYSSIYLLTWSLRACRLPDTEEAR